MKRPTVVGLVIGLLALLYGAAILFGPLALGEHRPESDPPADHSRF